MRENTSLPERRVPLFPGGERPADQSSSPPPSSPAPPQEPESPKPPPRKPSSGWLRGMALPRWARRLAFLLGILLLLFLALAGTAWYLASDAGFRAFVLPRIARATGLELAASRVEWSPLSSIILHDLRVGPAAEPLFQAKHVTMRYDGFAFLARRWQIESLAIESPVVRATSPARTAPPPAADSRDAAPSDVSAGSPAPSAGALSSLRIAKLSVRDLKLLYTSPAYVLTVSNLRLEASDIRPGGQAAVELETDWVFNPTPAAGAERRTASTPIVAHGKFTAQVGLDPGFVPRTIAGELIARGLNGTIAGEPLDHLLAKCRVDLSTSQTGVTMLKQAQVTILKNNAVLATMSATGPLDLVAGTMDLDLQTGPIQSNVLEILFFAHDLDFEKTTVSYVGHISIGSQGNLIKSEGRLDADIQSVTSPRLPPGIWKPVVVRIDHSVECDRARRHLVVNRLDLDVKQQNRPLAQALLDKPLFLSWAEKSEDMPQIADTDFTLKVVGLDCTAWLPLLGFGTEWGGISGLLDATAKVSATSQGHNLDLDLHAGFSRGACARGGVKLTDASLQFDGRVGLKNLRSAQTQGATLKVGEKGKPLFTATVDAALDLAARTGSGVLRIESPLPNVAALRPSPDFTLASGDLKGGIDWKLAAGNQLEGRTDLQINNLSFSCQGAAYQQAAAIVKGTCRWTPDTLGIENGQVSFFLASQPAGSWMGNLAYSASTRAVQSTFTLQNWRAAAMGPLLARWLPGRRLKSIELNSQGQLRTENGAINLKAEAGVRRFAMEPGLAPSLAPLDAALTVDASFATNGTATIRSASLQLDPTSSARNRVVASGTIRKTPSLFHADLNLRGETLDVTPWFDQLFPPETPSAASASAPAPAAPSAAGAPAAASPARMAAAPSINRDIRLQVAIDSLKLHDILVTNLKAPFRMRGDAVELPDTQFKLNGATVTAKIVPETGPSSSPYYFEVKADSVPIQPLAAAFMPSVKEEIGGTATATFTGRSRGTTLEEFKQNLAADATLAVRQAHLQELPGIQKALVEISIGTLCPEITKSSVDNIDASAHIAGQKIRTDNFHLTGSAIEATLRGDCSFDKQLNMEALLKLNRAVINRSSWLAPLVTAVSKEQGEWIRLPASVPITGTTADPKFHFDPKKMLGESLLNTGIKVLENILKPKDASTNNAPPASGQPPPEKKKGLFDDLLNGLFGK